MWRLDEHFLFQGHDKTRWHELFAVLSGSAYVKCGEKTWLLEPGDLLLLPPGSHWISWNPDADRDAPVLYNLDFEGELPLLQGLLEKGLVRLPAALEKYYSRWTPADFPFTRYEMGGKWGTEKLMSELLLLLSQAVEAPARLAAARKGDPAPVVLRAITQLVKRDPTRLHTYVELAEWFLADPSWLAKAVKTVTGKPLGDLYLEEKIKQAQKLIKTGKSVEETARLSGFGSEAKFRRAFRQITGREA